MGKSINRVTLLGRVGKDPEGFQSKKGTQYAKFSMATSEEWVDKKTGEVKKFTEWHNIVIYNENLAKVALDYLKSGDQVLVEGAVKTRKYFSNKYQHDMKRTEIVVRQIDSRLSLIGGKSSSGTVQEQLPLSENDFDDEIPF